MLHATVEENVLVQLENLRTHPSVAKAVATGELRADTDIEQFVFELSGIYQVTQQSRRLLNDPDADRRALVAFDRLVRDYAVLPDKE